VLLTGCSTTIPVKQKFPEAPEVLMQKCPALETIEEPKVLLSDLMKTVTRNYMKYHNCKDLAHAWQDWYKDQKKIFEEANSGK
jgi:hypothetical protein